MNLIYIAGPITASTEALRQANIDYACYRAAFYWEKGYSVICPHANTMNVASYINRPDFDWIPGDIDQLKRCDAICLLKGWEKSKGVRTELMVALRHNLEIIIDEDDQSLYPEEVDPFDPKRRKRILSYLEGSPTDLEQLG